MEVVLQFLDRKSWFVILLFAVIVRAVLVSQSLTVCIVSVSGAIIQSYSATWSHCNNLLAPKTLSITFGDPAKIQSRIPRSLCNL